MLPSDEPFEMTLSRLNNETSGPVQTEGDATLTHTISTVRDEADKSLCRSAVQKAHNMHNDRHKVELVSLTSKELFIFFLFFKALNKHLDGCRLVRRDVYPQGPYRQESKANLFPYFSKRTSIRARVRNILEPNWQVLFLHSI